MNVWSIYGYYSNITLLIEVMVNVCNVLGEKDSDINIVGNKGWINIKPVLYSLNTHNMKHCQLLITVMCGY